MGFFNRAIEERIQERYELAQRRLLTINTLLSSQKRIEMNENLSRVTRSIAKFLEFFKINDEKVQGKVIDLLFSLSESRSQEADKKSGAHGTHMELIYNYNIAANVIEDLLKLDPDFQGSKDIQRLHRWLRSAVVDLHQVDLKNLQAESIYPIVVFELVQTVIRANPKERRKEIYGQVDDLLYVAFPKGLRVTRSLSAIEAAYKKGARKAARRPH